MLRNRRIQVGCVLAASALTLFSVRPSLVVADAGDLAPPLSIVVPIGGGVPNDCAVHGAGDRSDRTGRSG